MPPSEHSAALPTLSSEFGDADLGDARLTRRLGGLADRIADKPGESFPRVFDDAELEAAYRFFGNEGVTPEAVLAPHFRQSVRRAAGLPFIIVAHDTTAFEFGGQTRRSGLGHLIRPSAQGFFGHFSLGMSADGDRIPLGLLAMETCSVYRRPLDTNNGRATKALASLLVGFAPWRRWKLSSRAALKPFT